MHIYYTPLHFQKAWEKPASPEQIPLAETKQGKRRQSVGLHSITVTINIVSTSTYKPWRLPDVLVQYEVAHRVHCATISQVISHLVPLHAKKVAATTQPLLFLTVQMQYRRFIFTHAVSQRNDDDISPSVQKQRLQPDPTLFNQCHHTHSFINLVKAQLGSNTAVKKLIVWYWNEATSQGQVLPPSETRSILAKGSSWQLFIP